jgi:hypothetical protein
MSYFICGKLFFKNNITKNELEKLTWVILNEAILNNLYIGIGCNISQLIVFEILNQDELGKGVASLPFLITGNPLHDTSDEIISPYVLDFGGKSYLASLRDNLNKLSVFFKTLFNKNVITNFIIFFSEGIDTEYEKIDTNINSFVDDIYNKCNVDDIPSLKIIVKK